MARPSQIAWLPRGATRLRTLPCTASHTSALGPGLRFEDAWTDGPGELPEGSIVRHLVWVAGAPVRYEKTIDGAWRDVAIEPGDCTVQPAGAPFAARWYGPIVCPLVVVEASALGAMCGGAAVELRPALAVKDPLLAQLVLTLRDEARAGCPSGQLYGETLGAALALHLVRRYSAVATGERRGGLSASRLRHVLEHIQSGLAHPLALDELAAVAGTAVTHFAHAFKQSTGYAPHQYVLRKRVELAAALLRTPRLTMAEISVRCGFADQSHLARWFRRFMGASPRDFRNALRS